MPLATLPAFRALPIKTRYQFDWLVSIQNRHVEETQKSIHMRARKTILGSESFYLGGSFENRDNFQIEIVSKIPITGQAFSAKNP